MLDKTNDDEVVLSAVDKSAPAIFVRMQAAVGVNRTIEMSFGIPLDMRPSDLNAYIDKVMACADRQNEIGLLLQLKSDLQEGYRRLEENIQHLSNYQAQHEGDWYASGRKGEWQPGGAQRAQLNTYATNIKGLREELIPTKQKQIAELEEKLRGK